MLALNLAGILAWASAPGRVVGVATAEGSFRVDHAPVSGNATLFDGATVQTEEAASRLRLDKGTRVELAAESRARVFGGRTLLDAGLSEMQTSSGYQIEARSLRIATGGAKSVARVRLDGDKTVLVAAVNGPVRVFNSAGLLLANVNSGTTLRFEPQAGAQDAFEFSGCLLRKAGKLILVDQTANQTVEVRGDAAQLGAQVGNRVRIKGPAAGTPLVMNVQALEQIGLGGCVAVAAGAGADPVGRAPAPAPAAEPSNGHSALIAGVAVAGAGGAIAGVVLGTRKKTKSP
ncbi:MAG: hypothetical protein HY822_07110 [Acidobacteria bacterium]|nr:hypothetical protein [Acidobacteriota bacterium]